MSSEKTSGTKKFLFILLILICAGIVILAAANVFFLWQLAVMRPTATVDVNLSVTQTLGAAQTEYAMLATQNAPSDTPEPVVIPTDTIEPAPTETETLTPIPTLENGQYWVRSGDTLESIGAMYGRSVHAMRYANEMIGDNVLIGETLFIPEEDLSEPKPYVFSRLQFSDDYPQYYSGSRFTMHTQTDRLAYRALQPLIQYEENALYFLEGLFAAPMPQPFDVYVASSLFQGSTGLRGMSYSVNYENYVVFDGTGNPDDTQYMLAHELTHMYMWNSFGRPVSTRISEGAAVYVGTQLIESAAHLPLDQFCAAHQEAGALPDISSTLRYEGHNYDLVNYYTAGCFFGYLYETYGADPIKLIYSTEDYAGVYGKSLGAMKDDFVNSLKQVSLEGVNPAQYVSTVKSVTDAYQSFFPTFTGSAGDQEIYRELDLARMAMLENRLEDANSHLFAAQQLIDQRPENQAPVPNELPTLSTTALPDGVKTLIPTKSGN
ncbi:MAG: LysM peptidoglycan-binding domain-containing protein [Anaerolineaceae bacterium]|nr:LysM peptidoglycan-binding domain-containing protein [Anaerolineaceae bacterium]